VCLDPDYVVLQRRSAVAPDSERSLVLDEWNRTQADYPNELCIHHLFEAQAARTPDAPALIGDGRTLSYAELNARANRLAHHLIAHGVGPDVCVGVGLDRSPEMVEGVLAVLKAGGAYVALDPQYPEERLRYMLADCAPAVLLAHASRADRWAGLGVSVVAVDRDDAWAGLAETNPERRGLAPEHLVYVIYTSGSTGRPKGVMNQHRTLVNRVAWARRAWGVTAADVVLCRTLLTFDGSVREIFLPLASGARVVLARPDGHRDPAYLVDTIRSHGITTVNLVPSLLQLLVAEAGLRECTTVRQVLCGGETMAPALVERLREQLPRVQLRQLYGPSEAATALTIIDCIGHAAGSTVPVGRPIANTRAYVLGPGDELVTVGVTGELYIGGVGVGRGYVGRAAMTAERFVPDPFSGEPGARLYRTGDLVRWLADGQIELLGRTDFQVKVRGQRVEPHEVEKRLCSHPQVSEAVVTAREHAPGDQRLVAYYVASSSLSAEALRAHLLEQLPDYMVPAAYVWLAQLPLTPNGKLDRGALPAPADEAYARRGYEAPVDETERTLAGIWSEVLGIERVGRHDHFFDLGGHSLMAVQVISRVRQALDVEVALSELFRRPVLADFAEEIIDAQLAQFDPDDVAELVSLVRNPTSVDVRVRS
jgi:amino acid adenylation domain-containing protein